MPMNLTEMTIQEHATLLSWVRAANKHSEMYFVIAPGTLPRILNNGGNYVINFVLHNRTGQFSVSEGRCPLGVPLSRRIDLHEQFSRFINGLVEELGAALIMSHKMADNLETVEVEIDLCCLRLLMK